MREAAFLGKMQDPGHPNVVGLAAALEDGRFPFALHAFRSCFLCAVVHVPHPVFGRIQRARNAALSPNTPGFFFFLQEV